MLLFCDALVGRIGSAKQCALVICNRHGMSNDAIIDAFLVVPLQYQLFEKLNIHTHQSNQYVINTLQHARTMTVRVEQRKVGREKL